MSRRSRRTGRRRPQGQPRSTGPGSLPTLSEYLNDTWLPAMRPVLRPGPHSLYSKNLRKHVIPALGHLRLDRIEPRAINALYSQMLGGARPLAPSTVSRIHRVFHRAMRDAVRWGLLEVNPVGRADPPREPFKEQVVWDPQQVRTFLAGARDDPLYELWLFYALTGVRRGEALGLRWSDVDLEGRWVSIRRALVMVDHQPWLGETKTARGRRTMAIDSHLAAALTGLRRRQEAAGRGRPEDVVFARPDGSSLHPDQVTRWFQDLSQRIGLPRTRLHALRHAHASAGLAAGVDIKIMSVRLGHSRISMTADVYQHVVPSIDREAAGRLAQVLLPPSGAPASPEGPRPPGP